MGAPRHRRQRWRREIDESKVDMGLIAPVSQEAIDLSLYAAVLDGDHQGIRDLAFMKPDANMRVYGKLGEPEGTLLHFAVRHGTLKTVIALLQLGADPLLKDSDGAIPREVAAQKATGSRMRTVLELWEKRKNPRLISSGEKAADGGDDGEAEQVRRRA
ncbi:MAG: hypothetical protein EPN97_07185 [Alphaproteobacteria bacterium]|nr:MAG: hypothetical protein EPN97_07185 [Alphaproteobacteria bacterium]